MSPTPPQRWINGHGLQGRRASRTYHSLRIYRQLILKRRDFSDDVNAHAPVKRQVSPFNSPSCSWVEFFFLVCHWYPFWGEWTLVHIFSGNVHTEMYRRLCSMPPLDSRASGGPMIVAVNTPISICTLTSPFPYCIP